MDKAQSNSAGTIYGILAAVVWGAWPVLSRAGIDRTLSPQDITVLRFAVAGLILLPVFLRHRTGGANWWQALCLCCGAGVPYVLVMVAGLSFAPAGHAGVITPASMLAFSTLGGVLLLGDRMQPHRLFGLAVIVLGLCIIDFENFAATTEDFWVGDLMFLAGGLLWASYTVGCRAWSVDPLQATALVSVLSMLGFTPVYLVTGQQGIFEAPLSEVAFQAIFQGIFAAVLALLFYTRSVAILGPSRGAVFSAMVPGIAVLLAYPVLGDVPSAFELAGVITVTLGVTGALGCGGTSVCGAGLTRLIRFLGVRRKDMPGIFDDDRPETGPI